MLSLLHDINTRSSAWEILGFLDDDPQLHGRTVDGAPVLGGIEWLETRAQPPEIVLGLGAPAVKRRVVGRIGDRCGEFPSLVHPGVTRSSRVELEEGAVVAAGSILTSRVRVQSFALVNMSCTVAHDTTIGAYASIGPGVNLSGNVDIREGAELGTGTKVIPGVTVGAWSITGAGAVVTQSVAPNVTVVGVPAKVIKKRPTGWHL